MICNNSYHADILRVCEIKGFNLGYAFSKSLSIFVSLYVALRYCEICGEKLYTISVTLLNGLDDDRQ